MAAIALEQREAYSEVLEVLRHMNKIYVDKIPKKIIMFFYDNCSLDYEYRMTKPIEEEVLKESTIDILALLNLNYWSKASSKEDLIMKYAVDEKNFQTQINNQLEQENVFTKIEISKSPEEQENSGLPAVINTSFDVVKKVLGFIKDLIIKIFGD